MLSVTWSDPGVKREGIKALLAVAALVLGIGAWAWFTPLAGAVVARGMVVVESSSKQVQHLEGGTVVEILVRNEDTVVVGTPLIRLDDTELRATLAIVEGQLMQALAIEARLEAEVMGNETFETPAELASSSAADIVATEVAAMRARREVSQNNVDQLQEQIRQTQSELDSLGPRRAALEAQLAMLEAELESVNKLLKDGLVQFSRHNELRIRMSELGGEIATLTAGAAVNRAMISERQIMIRQVTSSFLSDALRELQSVRERIGQLREQQITARDRLSKALIVAPQSGIVHQSSVHTVGGVISPGEVLMLIVPMDDRLVLELRISPLDIEKVFIGQEVAVRMPGFNMRETPDLPAKVTQLSADLSRDALTGEQFYTARLALQPNAQDLLGDHEILMPGMPVDAFIQTGSRNAFSYLIEPLVDQFRFALRES